MYKALALTLALGLVCIFLYVGCSDDASPVGASPVMTNSSSSSPRSGLSLSTELAEAADEEFTCNNVGKVYVRFTDPGYIDGTRVGMWVKYEGMPEGRKVLRIWWDYQGATANYRDVDISDVTEFEQILEHEYTELAGETRFLVRIELILRDNTGNCARNRWITTAPAAPAAANPPPRRPWTGAGASWNANGVEYGRFTWAEAGIVNNGRANAEAYCTVNGGTLARPNSQAEWDGIRSNLVQDSLGWWIDGHNDFTCGSALPGTPKSYQYGNMYAPTGTPNLYTGCNCNPGETGLVVYRYNGAMTFDGCQGSSTPVGNLGAMDEQVSYSHGNIVGFICAR